MPPKPKAQALPTDDWAQPKRDDNGVQIGDDNLPLGKVARAMALAAAGQKSDPGEIVTPEEIAAYDPEAAAKDREAAGLVTQQQAEETEKSELEERGTGDDTSSEQEG